MAGSRVGRLLGPEHRGQREKVGEKHLEAGKGCDPNKECSQQEQTSASGQ